MDNLETGGRWVVNERQPVHNRFSGKRRRDRDGEVQELAGGVDPSTKRSAGKAEEPGDPWVLEPNRGVPIRSYSPKARLVVGHEQIASPIEDEVVPHRRHPASGQRRLGEQNGCG